MPETETCIVVETESEVESRRVKYLLNREGIQPENGIIFFIKRDERYISELVNQLMAKTAPDRVHLYTVEKEEFKPDIITKKLSFELEGSRESTEKIVKYIIARRKGTTLKTDLHGTKHYLIYTKKGNVEVRLKIVEKNKGHCEVSMRIHGFKDAVELIYEQFKNEVELFN